ncbi:MAG: alpha/beta hydrolase [Loktanella sp.]|nr:alpha/beta hydrolase [Loktanella sp.]
MKQALFINLALIAILVSAAIISAVVAAFVDPTSSFFAVVGSMVWATFGRSLLLVTLLACLIGIAVQLNDMKRLAGLVLTLSTTGLAGSVYILAQIYFAGIAAGGEINLPAAFLLDDMQQPAPDLMETLDTADGVDLRAAIYLPPPMLVPAPVIVYIHGGGFMAGTHTETAADLRWCADKGWLVISVEYRLFGPDRPTWGAAPEDVRCALVWTSAHAASFGGDPTRLALLGDSAGGNLAINAGFAAAVGGTTSRCGPDVPVPIAIAVQYPAVDPTSIYNDVFAIPGSEPRMLIEGYIGASPDQYPARLAAVSSATFLTRVAPPTLIILTQKDSLVVASGTLAFVQDAKAAGVDIELVQIPFANQIFNQVAANSLGNQIGRTVHLRFLADHLRWPGRDLPLVLRRISCSQRRCQLACEDQHCVAFVG